MLRGAGPVYSRQPNGRRAASRGTATKEVTLLKQGTPTAPPVRDQTADLWAYFRGQIVPLGDARISVMTHAFNYGTAVFEGIRAYWNAEEEQLFALDLLPHYERLLRSARLLHMEIPLTAQELADATLEVLRRDGLREDVYIRPLVYKSSESIGVRLHNLDADVVIFGIPFGQYIDTEGGIRAQVSSWRRTDDNAIPARSKITGAYVNGALAKSEAQMNGFDEAIVLTQDGHVSEGSAENLFIVKGGRLITPPVTDNILEGITRRRLMNVALRAPRGSGRGAEHRPHRAVYRGRGLPVRHRCAALPGCRDRSTHDRRRSARTDHAAAPRRLLRGDPGRIEAYRDWLTPVY